MKTAFLILGAQRSGTSVASHMLSKFGVHFGNPDRFLQAGHNPIFFELKWVNQYNDRLIQSLGYQYTDFFLPIEADFDRENIVEIAQELPDQIRNEWGNETVIGIKDPRFSLTFPVWEKALTSLGYKIQVIFALRHPGEFLQSNRKLFHNWEGWDETRHFNFWLQLNFAATYFTRDYPVFFIRYDDVMSAPLKVAERLADFFHLAPENVAAAAAVVDSSQYHHRQSNSPGDPRIDYYYKQLTSHCLSAIDYLNYRSQFLSELPEPIAQY